MRAKFRFDLEMAIGLEFGVAAGGTDMVQHEDGADACEDRSQQKCAPKKYSASNPARIMVFRNCFIRAGAGLFEYGSKLANHH